MFFIFAFFCWFLVRINLLCCCDGPARFFTFPPAGSTNKRVGKVCLTFLPNFENFQSPHQEVPREWSARDETPLAPAHAAAGFCRLNKPAACVKMKLTRHCATTDSIISLAPQTQLCGSSLYRLRLLQQSLLKSFHWVQAYRKACRRRVIYWRR